MLDNILIISITIIYIEICLLVSLAIIHLIIWIKKKKIEKRIDK